MKVSLISLLTAVFITFSCQIQAKNPAMSFFELSGEVTVRPDNDFDDWKWASLEKEIKANEHVKTQRDAAAIFNLAERIWTKMDAETEIIAGHPEADVFVLQFIRGAITVDSISEKKIEIKLSQTNVGIDSQPPRMIETIVDHKTLEAALENSCRIKCVSSRDGAENRVTVLQGRCKVYILLTREVFELNEGETLLMKKDLTKPLVTIADK